MAVEESDVYDKGPASTPPCLCNSTTTVVLNGGGTRGRSVVVLLMTWKSLTTTGRGVVGLGCRVWVGCNKQAKGRESSRRHD